MLVLSVILWMKMLSGALLNSCLSFAVTNEVVWLLFIKKITSKKKKSPDGGSESHSPHLPH